MKNVAKTNGMMVPRPGYREDAIHDGYAYKNDGHQVMQELAERISGVNDKESRTLSADDAMGISGNHIEITFGHPDFAR